MGRFLIGIDNLRDGNQGKDKEVNGKPLQDKMFCDKEADDSVQKCAVCADSAKEGICDSVLEEENKQAVQDGEKYIGEAAWMPEISPLVIGIFCGKEWMQELKQRFKEDVCKECQQGEK